MKNFMGAASACLANSCATAAPNFDFGFGLALALGGAPCDGLGFPATPGAGLPLSEGLGPPAGFGLVTAGRGVRGGEGAAAVRGGGGAKAPPGFSSDRRPDILTGAVNTGGQGAGAGAGAGTGTGAAAGAGGAAFDFARRFRFAFRAVMGITPVFVHTVHTYDSSARLLRLGAPATETIRACSRRITGPGRHVCPGSSGTPHDGHRECAMCAGTASGVSASRASCCLRPHVHLRVNGEEEVHKGAAAAHAHIEPR